MTQLTRIDLDSLAEAMLAELIAAHPSAFVGEALNRHAPAMLVEIRSAFETALAHYHGVMCVRHDLMSECMCWLAVCEIMQNRPSGKN